MFNKQSLLFSVSLLAYASAAVIPHRRALDDVSPQAASPTLKDPIIDLSKIKKVPRPASYDVSSDQPSVTTTTDIASSSAIETSSIEAQITTDLAGTTTSGPVETAAAESSATTSDEPLPTESNTVTPPSASGTATKGLLVQLTVPAGFTVQGSAETNATESDFASTLVSAVPAIEAEAGTLSWFGAQFTGADGAVTNSFAIFDTFADDAGRAAHLGGSVATSVIGQSANFVGGLSIDAFDILAIKNPDPAQANNVTLGLQAAFEAQPDKVTDVQQFCTDSLALAEAETGTINWLCGQWPGTNKFLILDSFVDETGRQAHLNGQIAQNLFALSPGTLVAVPAITEFNVVAASVKPTAAVDSANDTTAITDPVAASDSVTDTARFGLLVPFAAQPDTFDAVRRFVQGATSLATAEPGTLQWFGSAKQNGTENELLVFDTFATEADREAHLSGKVASGLLGQIASLSSVDVIPFDILAVKSLNDAAAVTSPTAGVTLGLQVLFNATSAETVPQVQQLCQTGLTDIQAEAGTLNWICGQITGTETFVVLDSFATEDDRNAHLNGKFASSLLSTVGTLINEPDIQQLKIFAGTTKPEQAAQNGDAEPSQTDSGAPVETTEVFETTASASQPEATTTTAVESTITSGVDSTTDSIAAASTLAIGPLSMY